MRDLNVYFPTTSLVGFFSNVTKFLLVVLKVQFGSILLFPFLDKRALKLPRVLPPMKGTT